MINCPICLQRVNELKSNSHVIPRWMLAQIKQNGRVKKITEKEGSKSSQLDQKGNLVCKECESLFTRCDNFSVDFFRLKKYYIETKNYSDKKDSVLVEFHKADAKDNLYLFIISILLRSHLYQHKYESRNLLGSYFESLRIKFINQDVVRESFPMVIFYYEKLDKAHEYPCRSRFDDLNYQRFMIFGYQFFIQLDQRAVPIEFRPLIIAEQICIPIIIGYDAKYFRDLKQLMKI